MLTRTVRFAQLTDVHLKPPTACRCWWMVDSVEEQFRRAIAEVEQLPELDFVLFTGDLVDQADPASFARFQAIASQLRIPYYISVGNHDIDVYRRRGRFDREDFLGWCRAQFAFDPSPTGLAEFSLSPLPGIRLVAVDASLGAFPAPQGTIRPEQVDWIRQVLETYRQDWILVMIHQPPLASVLFHKYRILSEQAQPLRQLLEGHDGIAAVLSGHLHVPKAYVRRRIPYLTGPAVAGPVSAFRVFELEPSGLLRYRWHHLPAPTSDPSPLWHGLIMGKPWDRHGEIRLRAPVRIPAVIST